ncbi:MAG: formate dehydrogenase subunit alpha [Desulfomonilia bacterium]|jgi:formate dehydrogenase alpha subunit
MAKIPTICPFCGCGCGFYLVTERGKVMGVEPNPNNPVNRGMLCAKGWNSYEFIHSPERLTAPLVRKEGELVESTWKEALDLVYSRLSGIREKFGPNSLGFLSSAKVSNEENYLFMKMVRAGFKSNNVDHCDRLCHSATVAGLTATFGSGVMTNSIGEFEDADLFLVTGSNTTEEHPLIGTRMINAVEEKGTKLILIEPREIPLSSLAKLHLKQNFGTDVAVYNGIMNIIIQEDLYDKQFVETRTEGFEALKSLVSRYTPKVVEQITGIRSSELYRAAVMYAQADKAMIVYAMGITQHITGTDNVKTLANLAMLTGHVGRQSNGVNPLRGQNNAQGACDMGALPGVFSGYQTVNDPATVEKFQKAWGVEGLDTHPGLTITGMMEAAHKGDLKALYIMGENPLMSDPDTAHIEHSLSNLDFLVVQDIFLTETAALADVILPAASFAEKEGTYTNTERRVQLSRKAVSPPGQARADWEIIADLLLRCGLKADYKGPLDIMPEINRLTPSYAGITYKRLSKGYGIQWPCPNEDHPGTVFLHRDQFTKGKGTFLPCEFKSASEMTDEEYDFTLTTGRSYYQYHTGTMTRHINILERESPEAHVEINPEDAKKLGIRNNDMVELESRRGAIQLKAEITPSVPKRVLFTSFHFRKSQANNLTNSTFNPISEIPELKGCSVKIRRCT